MRQRGRAGRRVALLVFAAVLAGCGAEQSPSPPRAAATAAPAKTSGAGSTPVLRTAFRSGLDSIDVAVTALSRLSASTDPDSARSALHAARRAYKRLEYLVELDPWRARAFNGPPIAIPDEDDPTTAVLAPRGLQVIEGAIYPELAPGLDSIVGREVGIMRQVLAQMRSEPDSLDGRRVAFDAVRLEVARVATLGIAGFDATLSGEAARESADALRGAWNGLESYRAEMMREDAAGWEALASAFEAAIADLDAVRDFDGFDRLEFLTGRIAPITDGLARLGRALRLPPPPGRMPWSAEATNIYAASALDPAFYAPDFAPVPTPALVALGRRLFHEPALSRARNRSCATCHQAALAFADGRRLPRVDPGLGRVRNTPSLLNAGMQAFQFADQRAAFLEFQAYQVLANPREMNLPAAAAAARIRSDTALTARFAAVFGHSDTLVTERALTVALAAYVRSLSAMRSAFDRAVQGDPGAMEPAARRGFNLFMGKAACATCHFAPIFGGTTPPSYLESEPEVIGVPARLASSPDERVEVDPDPGVYGYDHAELHRHAFKTPSLRNVALTAPYMHNGVFRTLEQVVDFYDRGGGNGLGMRLPNQTLSSDSLRLSRREKRDLVAFMRALTDSAYLSNR